MNQPVKKFEEIPEIDLQDIADYFNLEYGLTLFDGDEDDEELVERIKKEQFTPEHFRFLGVFEVDGVETMVWSVAGDDIYATVQPYESPYCIGMDSRPSSYESDE